MIPALNPTEEDRSSRRLHLLTWVSLCLALLVVGFTEATPVQAQNSLICTRDLCRVLRSDGQVLSSCGRGEACGTRHQDRNWVPPPSCPPLTTEETIREHTDVASCSSRRDGRIVSCCWIGDACHSDPGGSAAMGRRDIAGVKPGADAGFGGLIVRAGVSDSVLLVSTRSKPFLHPFRLKDGEFVHIWGPRGATWVVRTPTAGGLVWDVVDLSAEFSDRVQSSDWVDAVSALQGSVVAVIADARGVAPTGVGWK